MSLPTITDTDNEVISAALEQASVASLLLATDTKSAEQCNETLKVLSTTKRELDSRRKDLGKPLRDSLAEINDAFNKPIKALDTCVTTLKGTVGKYMAELKRKEQAAAEEAARIEREKAEHEAKVEAAKEEAGGQLSDEEEIAMELAAPVQTAPAVIERPKTSGVQMRSDIEAQVVDMPTFLQAIVDGLVDVDVIEVKAGALKKWAKPLVATDNVNVVEVHGVRIERKEVVAA